MKPQFKRAFIISSVVIFSGLCIWLAYKYKQSQTEDAYVANNASSSPVVLLGKTLSDIDSDKDGLKDWEETLWGTDAHNSDTDKDGTPDGTEVTLGRNPRIKGPNDSLDLYPMGSTATSSQKLTNTDLLSRELFAKYSAAKAKGGKISAQDEADIVQTLLQDAEAASAKPVQYSLTDLHIIQNPTSDELQSYELKVKDLVYTKKDPNVGNEIVILAGIVDGSNPQDVSKFAPISDYYHTTALSLLALRVPAGVAKDHLDVVNDYMKLAQNVKALGSVLTDTFTATSNFSSYVDTSKDFALKLQYIAQYLKDHGVVLQ